MLTFTGDHGKPYSLNYCCGVGEVGDFSLLEVPDCWGHKTALKDLKADNGTGMFVATFTPAKESNKKAMELLQKKHTLLFKSEKYINQSTYADKEGKEDGVILCVFKFGKES